jgi:hypothetical protein
MTKRGYIEYQILPNGNLLLTASNDARADYSDELKRRGSDEVFYQMMSAWRDNGVLFPIEPEWIGALTEAPIIAEFHTVEDDGTNTVDGKVWWFPNYMITDPMKELFHKGRVEFTLAESAAG